MRSRFDEQLDLLNKNLIEMGEMCERAISISIDSFIDYSEIYYHDDSEMARDYQNNLDNICDTVSEIRSKIEHKEREIESSCMKLLLQQQPVATDLRVISSALKMIYDMERIGIQASEIAEIANFAKDGNINNKISIKNMAVATVKMVTDSVDSFVKKDLNLAKSVIAYDDVVDSFFQDIRKELIKLISENENYGEVCIDLMMIAKYLERIGDHAVNIAQWVIYSITGQHIDDHQK